MKPRYSQSICLTIGLSLCFSPAVIGAGGVIKDVELTNSGTLRGRVIHPDGSAISLADVQVRYQGKTIAVANSSANGEFAIEQVRGGLHEVVVAGQSSPVRFWTCGTAPIGCPPEFCSEIPITQGQFCAPPENCQTAQGCAPVQQCVTSPNGLSGVVDIITLSTLGTSVAALVLAIDARNASNRATRVAGDALARSAGAGNTSNNAVASP